MWVFAYGSLMWDGWETAHGSTHHEVAELRGYCRAFNKASTRNWGTKARPGPTLNLTQAEGRSCLGTAFRFSDKCREPVMATLRKREGLGFELLELPIRVSSRKEVIAVVPIYDGKNLIVGKTIDEIAQMVLTATGTSGACSAYVKNVAHQMTEIGIADPAVTELCNALEVAVGRDQDQGR